jgi:hypothetical protein
MQDRVMSIRDREQEILLKIERHAEALKQANVLWSFEKCVAESWIAHPQLYTEYCSVREQARQRGIRPVLPRRRG